MALAPASMTSDALPGPTPPSTSIQGFTPCTDTSLRTKPITTEGPTFWRHGQASTSDKIIAPSNAGDQPLQNLLTSQSITKLTTH